jgi:beta-N-acetylhexosaminidase
MMMTAHVVYTALDPKVPATLSPVACTTLRDEVGFRGVLVSDDLEMRAIAARWGTGEAAVASIAAGCDALLVCWSEEKQEQAVDALEREAARSPAFRARCEQAWARVMEARRKVRAVPLDDGGLGRVIGGAESQAIAAEMARRMAS